MEIHKDGNVELTADELRAFCKWSYGTVASHYTILRNWYDDMGEIAFNASPMYQYGSEMLKLHLMCPVMRKIIHSCFPEDDGFAKYLRQLGKVMY